MRDYPRTIYAIQHNQTKRMYIGSTSNLESRYKSHIGLLRNHKHSSKEMQKDFDEYGEDFSLFVIDEIKDHSERNNEYLYMRKYRTNEIKYGYNSQDNGVRWLDSPTVEITAGKPKLPDGSDLNVKDIDFELFRNEFPIYERIEQLCEERDVSVHFLEKEMRFATGTLNKWERVIPRVDKLKRVAKFFGVSVDYFLE